MEFFARDFSTFPLEAARFHDSRSGWTFFEEVAFFHCIEEMDEGEGGSKQCDGVVSFVGSVDCIPDRLSVELSILNRVKSFFAAVMFGELIKHM